jgi:hypothetical protein
MSHTHNFKQLNVTKCLVCDKVAEITYMCSCYERSQTKVPCKCESKPKFQKRNSHEKGRRK